MVSKSCTFFPAPRQRGGLFSNLVLTSRQYFAFNGFPVVKALVPETNRGRHDVVLRPFSQGLIIETEPLLYKFCTFVCAALQYNRIFHDIRISHAFAPLALPCKDNTSVWSLSLFRDLSQSSSKSIPKKHEMDLISTKIRLNRQCAPCTQ